ncbi:PREDICTED: uncharacterized protein LOC109154771 [Ipomoea nil]|uniref:uncharacterized protein LOC109154771 n=1 Tax=Ipomoea nil TaxID=35883 RepID=UPI000901286E|nr:PREDICTED: uncharacterized protein LOC109154771 [Ipomoea nil]
MENDVAITLGFPQGGTKIDRRTKGAEDTTLLEDWKAGLKMDDLNITPMQLCKAMLAYKEGWEWFKRHLALLITTMFLESTATGYVNTYMINNFADVTKIADLNWCEYVLRSLVDSKVAWAKKTSQKFTGPIVFLTVFYVDRLVVYRRSVPRTFLAFKGWDTHLLNKREKAEISSGGFGYGYIDDPQELPYLNEEKKSDECEEELQVTSTNTMSCN